MSVQEEKLRAIADAIREKDGTEGPIPAKDFPERIRNISAMPKDVLTISVESSDPEAGTVSGGGIISKGMNAEVTIKAEPGEGYKFVAWQEDGQTVGEGAEYTLTVDRDRTLVATFVERNSSHNLPAGYTELEYVEATGAQYLNGYSPQAVYAFSIDVEMATSGYGYFWGATYYGSNSTPAYLQYNRPTTTYYTIISCFGKSGTTSVNITCEAGARMQITQNRVAKTMTINGEAYPITVNAITNYQAGAIFASKYYGNTTATQNGSIQNIARGKIYCWKISTQNDGQFTNEYIPCIQDSTGIAGFYDVIKNSFIKSASTTNFVPGPAL